MGITEFVILSVCSAEFCVLAVISCVLYYNVRYMNYKLPPRPQAWPVIGNMFATDPANLQFWCVEQAKKYGPILRYTMGFMKDAVIINDYKNATEALVERGKDFEGRAGGVVFDEHFEGRRDVAFGNPEQPTWHLRRKLLATSIRNFTNGRAFEHRTMFAFSSIKQYLDAKAESEEAFDPTLICKLFTANHISRICFNKTYEIDDEDFLRYTNDLEDLSKQMGDIHISDVLPFLNYLPFLMPDRRRAGESGEFVLKTYRDEIQKHKETFTGKEMSDLMYYILKLMSEDSAYSVLSEVEQRQIISDVFITSFETSRVQLRWILAILASHPETQERLYQEILHNFGTMDKNEPNSGISALDYRSSIPYIDAFILESSRFGTVTPLGLPRTTLRDTKVGGYDVPKGTMIVLNQYAINRSESEHDEPHAFRPERFLTEEGKLGPRPVSYISFGLGRRACPGETITRTGLWMTLVMLLRRYQVLTPEDETVVPRYSRMVAIVGEPAAFKIRLRYRD